MVSSPAEDISMCDFTELDEGSPIELILDTFLRVLKRARRAAASSWQLLKN
jgi:hypothetical protein